MKIYKNTIQVFLVMFLAAGYFFANSGENPESSKTEPKGDLARIAILNFDDKTGTKDFEYMSGSLGDAVNSSMLKNFTYERVNTEDIDRVIYAAKQNVIKDKVVKVDQKKEKKTDERLDFLKSLAKELKVDIVIFGRYDFDQAAQLMNIHTNVYYVAINEIADLPVVSNKVDSTIFGATDKAAANIITEIQKMAQQASQASETGKPAKDKKEEVKTGEPAAKIVLTRKMAKSYIRFVDNRNSTITDNFTKLTWQKCSMGQKNDPSCHGTRKTDTWEAAREYCSSLQLGDKTWRLPTAGELASILDARERPAIKVIFAPFSELRGNYWTSDLKNEKEENSPVVLMSFGNGEEVYQAGKNNANARCVSK